MRKKYTILLAITITLLYWVLDAYANTLIHGSSLIDEILLRTAHTIIFIKGLTAGLIFALSLTPLLLKTRVSLNNQVSLNEFGELQRIADILFSSLSTKINVIKSLEILEEILHLEASLLFTYNKDILEIYNENEFIKAFFRSKEIFPFRVTTTRSAIEEVVANCYIEKRATSKDSIKIDKKQVTLFSFILRENRSDKALGNLMLATCDAEFLEQNLALIQKFVPMLTFSLSIATKKELLQGLNSQYSNDTISTFDKTLNIMNFSKLQEYIEQEYKRHKRYHTALTLVLIDITLLKNLIKIFPAEVVTSLKKDFIQLVRKNTREVDIFGKWTNDQFALLLPDVDFHAAQKVAKKLQNILDNTKFARVGKISCTYGITSLSPSDTVGSFKARAESALLVASAKEGNDIEVKLQMAEH